MKTKVLFLGIIISIISFKGFAQTGNYALSFDGVDDYVTIPHNNYFNVSKVTIEMWMLWQNTTVAADVDFLIAKSLEELEIHTGGGSLNHGLRFIPTDSVYLDTEENVFQSGTWYHIAFIYDPSISFTRCYINGVQKPLTNHGLVGITKAITQSSDPLQIGMRIGGSMSFQGKIDEVRLWNVVRTAEQINANMYLELTGSEPGLFAYYKMSNGSGTSLTDNSLNGHTGTLMNGVQWAEDEALPVELTSFDAKVNGTAVTLDWKTATEINNYGFEIQRSINSKESSTDNWQKIGFVKGHGNSNSDREYTFTDYSPVSGKVKYRLKQLDNSGQSFYYNAISVEVDAPGIYKLMQNSPNPFNPSTAITFQLPLNSHVAIKVYDQLGREVTTLVNEQKPSGSHVVYWNGKSSNGDAVASGVYLYRLSAGNYTETRKMNLLK